LTLSVSLDGDFLLMAFVLLGGVFLVRSLKVLAAGVYGFVAIL